MPPERAPLGSGGARPRPTVARRRRRRGYAPPSASPRPAAAARPGVLHRRRRDRIETLFRHCRLPSAVRYWAWIEPHREWRVHRVCTPRAREATPEGGAPGAPRPRVPGCRFRPGRHRPDALTSSIRSRERAAANRTWGGVVNTTAGRDGSVGRREATPPRSRITSSASAAGPVDSERKRSATVATTSADWPTSPCVEGSRSAFLIASACSLVESTSRRRLTTHQIRVGAVRRAGARSACDASHQTAMSRQAVLPSPVGTPISTGHSSVSAICAARRACQGNGSRSLIAR